ncbi:biotin carboxylase N-terminal domain-containing protein [Hydrogenophaga sp. IBVHS2]|uniref:acetyl/propionyl/methylcrotonyl-CoA carboxylase subunit alpha n=1 Tax=Hydrogenophaga sp. IBVHS2 TaxID=1985170 RepID=UPI000A2E1094|nr:carbamoyl-phosphate synthase large subunit [Hydrogenophaga sp. IBVHS2]
MQRLLIANRGEIARRIVRTAHRLGLSTVAVYSQTDAQALPVREATTAFALGGHTAAESYLRIDRLLDAARATGADAVHPGYGFLSENADFAQAVIDAGLTWVGPPPAAIRALGSKAAAKALAQQHGVPVLPGYAGVDQSDATFLAEAQRVGYPLMVKAVAGGGGRGMRLVHSAADLPAALASARAEALAGFGNADLLIERALLRPRHVEVQVLADAHGHCIHLGERDCSVQRRHQKIIEEAPSPAVDEALRQRLGQAAVALAKAAGYVGAGTVEFLLEDGQFFLMEMNTRLQVEHPVTEMLTGLDLVEWQLRIARGEPLTLQQTDVHWQGHAIEVRLCSEDEHLAPHTGTIAAFAEPPAAPGLRFDHAIEPGLVVGPHFDSMLGKLIIHAPTREAAAQQLAQALDATVLLGLPSNRELLAACLRHPSFVAGQALIPFLAEEGEALRQQLQPPPAVQLAAVLAAWAHGQPLAERLSCPWARPLRWRCGDVALALQVQEHGQGTITVSLADQTHTARIEAGAVHIVGMRHTVTAVRLPAHNGVPTWQVQVGASGGSHTLILQDLSHQPQQRADGATASGEVRAPFNGRVAALLVQPGQRVARGDALLAIESMKIEHRIGAPRDGVVEALAVAVGQQVAPGQRLLTLAAST